MKKTMTTTQKIKALIELGKTNEQIIGAVPKATMQQVYNQRYWAKKKLEEKGKEDTERLIRYAQNYSRYTTKEDKPANEVQVGGEHYKDKHIQPWDAIHAWGLGFFSGNVVKYVARHREKNGIEDLKKARHYLDKLIELMEKPNVRER